MVSGVCGSLSTSIRELLCRHCEESEAGEHDENEPDRAALPATAAAPAAEPAAAAPEAAVGRLGPARPLGLDGAERPRSAASGGGGGLTTLRSPVVRSWPAGGGEGWRSGTVAALRSTGGGAGAVALPDCCVAFGLLACDSWNGGAEAKIAGAVGPPGGGGTTL